jgi:hypothetical protein
MLAYGRIRSDRLLGPRRSAPAALLPALKKMQQQRDDFPREIIRTPQIRFQLGNRYGGDALCAVRETRSAAA